MNESNIPDHEPVKKAKSVLVIVDGLGDLPIAALGDKTPLEAAETPVLDHLAGHGRYGLVDPIKAGKVPNTHSGTGLLMGVLPRQAGHLSRGPVEAAGAGRTLKPGEIAFRANFASMERRHGDLWVTDRRAGRVTDGTDELASVLKDIDLGDGVFGSLFSTDQHRGVLVLSGNGLDTAVKDSDPGSCSLPVALEMCRPKKPAAELTASKVDRFIDEAFQRLVQHPVNLSRLNRGKLPANGILTRGAGAHLELDSLMERFGISAAVITGCNTVRGLGRLLNFEALVDHRFTADEHTDLNAKVSAALNALEYHDMVFMHVKATDIFSHDCKPLHKRDFLEKLDRALEPLMNTRHVIAVGADHTTDSNTGFHTADPVPALICSPGSETSGPPVRFGENQCRRGNMDRQTNSEFFSEVLREMGYSVP